ANRRIEVTMRYPAWDFDYRIVTTALDGGVTIDVVLDKPLPEELAQRAGFNLEFLPVAYFGKAFLMDEQAGIFPRHPTDQMTMQGTGKTEPEPFASGQRVVLAPEDRVQRITVASNNGVPLQLYDGRGKAQNGWYVLRSLLPSGKTGTVLSWSVNINTLPEWSRAPVIAHSQVGYHPAQEKIAVIELDKHDTAQASARLLKINADGSETESLKGAARSWGRYLRYNYLQFDFSAVKQPGLYRIEYGNTRTAPFRIADNVYANVWRPTLDVYLPVQMDHVRVREAYRTWHGASHLDDALQAPTDYEHFDLYAMGASTDTKFKALEHIPGLNIGGWYDAGDYDIRTQTQYALVQALVQVWEQFGIDRDNTTVSQDTRYVELHRPDGRNDLLQQIEHGTLALIAQHRAVGHAIHGIVAGHLYQYPHLGDGVTKTDGLAYDPALDPHAAQRHPGKMFDPSTVYPAPAQQVATRKGERSGEFDDRWAFTTRSTALNYGSAAALAAASRALRGYNDALAEECLRAAIGVWGDEHSHAPFTFRFGNTTGGNLLDEEFSAALELLVTTREKKYADRIQALLPEISARFDGDNVIGLLRAMPMMDDDFKAKVRDLAVSYRDRLDQAKQENPFAVTITREGWAGNGRVVDEAIAAYYLHRAFPDLMGPERVVRGLDYLLGTHPASDVSFVSAVGTQSQVNAYGMNRADFSFIPGGIVPGVLVLPPDLPENRQDWPFFWGQNEYVVGLGGSYIFLANAVQALLAGQDASAK
ncbi:MAG: glycoside hydrolase family 9 protein, partial [Pseudoxanthomonas sp.]